MYLLKAPKERFGILPPKTPLITDEVLFTNNVAYCPKFFWYKHHKLQGCEDVSPLWFREERKKRSLSRILIIATGGLGDSMWSMPVARYLKETYPKARILIATEEKNMPIWSGVPYADVCVKNEFWNLQALVRNSDEVYDFGGIATFLKAEMKLDPIEATFKHVDLPLPNEIEKLRPLIVPTLDEGKQAEAKLKRHGADITKDKIITIALETSTSNRNWPFSYVRSLTEKLIREGMKVVWLGIDKDRGNTYFFACKCGWEFTTAIEDRPDELSFTCPICKEKNKSIPIDQPGGVINLSGKTNIRECMSIIAMSDAVIAPNSSLMVIATALNIPTIGLFGAFDPKQRAKFYEKFTPLWGKAKCAPCDEHWTECKNGHPAPCMKLISPNEVFIETLNLLKKYPRKAMERIPIE